MVQLVTCPQCRKRVEYEGNEFRPFCSERCKLLDLGAWADEEYSMPVDSSAMTEEERSQLEKIIEEKHR
jgi:endogenous inhibitor of DNA gyrase (YacG/DUF329 family)